MVHEAPTPSHFQGTMVDSFPCSSHLSHTTHLTHTNFLDEEILTRNDLGKAGLIRFTNDPSMVTKHPEMSKSIFYALQAALQNGTVSNLATALYDDNKCNPLDLWRNIEQWYDTSLIVPMWCSSKSRSY